jgi:hypothetical protein
MEHLPLVIFFDIDRTLIGRADCLVTHYFLWKALREWSPELATALGNEPPIADETLVRPELGESLRRLFSALRRAEGADTIELFVCSLGTKHAVSECKVPGIERIARIRFNKPYFCTSYDDADNCRSYMDDSKKLVRPCFERAIDVLARKAKWRDIAGWLQQPATRQAMFDNRFIMIDDTPNVALEAESNSRLLCCDPYQVRPWYDVVAKLRRSVPPRLLEGSKGRQLRSVLQGYLSRNPLPTVPAAPRLNPDLPDGDRFVDLINAIESHITLKRAATGTEKPVMFTSADLSRIQRAVAILAPQHT